MTLQSLEILTQRVFDSLVPFQIDLDALDDAINFTGHYIAKVLQFKLNACDTRVIGAVLGPHFRFRGHKLRFPLVQAPEYRRPKLLLRAIERRVDPIPLDLAKTCLSEAASDGCRRQLVVGCGELTKQQDALLAFEKICLSPELLDLPFRIGRSLLPSGNVPAECFGRRERRRILPVNLLGDVEVEKGVDDFGGEVRILGRERNIKQSRPLSWGNRKTA